MTDQELLELAAKAAGIQYAYSSPGLVVRDGDLSGWWNPLIDDGEALRLAVRLSIDVLHRRTEPAEVWAQPPLQRAVIEPVMVDRLAATRRAIVKAAVEIRKNIHSRREK